MEKALSAEQLRNCCKPDQVRYKTTEEIEQTKEIIGQKRAVNALKFGLGIKVDGFNVFVAGPQGTGRETAVKNFLEEFAKDRPVPSDCCYVNNFKDPYTPNFIKLPPGTGQTFKKDMKDLINEIRRVLPESFKSEDYTAKRESTVESVEKERKKLFDKLTKKAEEEDFVLRKAPSGLLIIPQKDGKPLDEEEFMKLPKEERERIQKKKEKLGAELREAVRHLRKIERKTNEELKNLDREISAFVTDDLIDELRGKYKDYPEVLKYLDEVQKNILDNISKFTESDDDTSKNLPFPFGSKEPSFKEYEVNVLVDNSDVDGAPVIIEHNPTYQNLIGKIEKVSHFGTLTTDFTMIRPGALHKANGGYLLLTVEDLLKIILSWEGLKKALTNKCITIEEAAERLGLTTTKSLKPQPIPLEVKVVLIGTPRHYQLLYMLDMQFKELFKVKAEFDNTMERTEKNIDNYVSLIGNIAKKEELKHLDASGVAAMIEHSSRLAGHQNKLTTKFADIADILREANYYAVEKNSEYITSSHIKNAIEEKVYRSNLIQEKIQELIEQKLILIDTKQEKIGQVNGLSVINLGDFTFGRPSRVTTSIGLGRKGIIDIERESKLGGKIHTKGVMIIAGYITEKYAQDKPLSLSARLVFEQSYGEIEGDSASSTELYALLSNLSGLPIKQYIAVTGSVNQKGEIQAIGGVNEKIEGFFEVCEMKGLTGEQGVIIPESNVQNLMLKEKVIEAVKSGQFHIYPVKTIDDGIEILTGVSSGKRKPAGTFEEGTVNYRVDNKLKEIAEKLKEFPVTEEEKNP
jgi:lon-related putative ATP-dependent protease